MRIPRPEPSTIYFQQYIDQAPEGDVEAILAEQIGGTCQMFEGLSEAQAEARYEPGKWSIKEVLGHMADTERVFNFRILWLARGAENTLAGFDQDEFITHADFDQQPIQSLIAQFKAVRAATLGLLQGIAPERFQRQATVSGNSMTVATIPWILAGHECHHRNVLKERYSLPSPSL